MIEKWNLDFFFLSFDSLMEIFHSSKWWWSCYYYRSCCCCCYRYLNNKIWFDYSHGYSLFWPYLLLLFLYVYLIAPHGFFISFHSFRFSVCVCVRNKRVMNEWMNDLNWIVFFVLFSFHVTIFVKVFSHMMMTKFFHVLFILHLTLQWLIDFCFFVLVSNRSSPSFVIFLSIY